jgi:hypothetical protein
MDKYIEQNHLETMNKYLPIIKEKPEVDLLIEMIRSNPEILNLLIDLIKQDKGNIKFYSEKVIRKMSETDPIYIYTHFRDIASFIESKNHFIQWGAIQTIANLIKVDTHKYFDTIYDMYFELINSDSMITAANVVGNAWKIIIPRPDLENDITKRLLNILNNTYYIDNKPSPECKNILIGHLIDCFGHYYHLSQNRMMIYEFVQKQQQNDRKSTVKKAISFLNDTIKT